MFESHSRQIFIIIAIYYYSIFQDVNSEESDCEPGTSTSKKRKILTFEHSQSCETQECKTIQIDPHAFPKIEDSPRKLKLKKQIQLKNKQITITSFDEILIDTNVSTESSSSSFTLFCHV